jgi:hypothetical protein
MTTTHAPSTRIRTSTHAVRRWIERVDTDATSAEARQALADFLCCGRARPTPRHWTDVEAAPGLRFVYWSSRPGVCALVVDGVVVTVLTRNLCRAGAPRTATALRTIGVPAQRSGRRPVVVAPWRWSGHHQDAA